MRRKWLAVFGLVLVGVFGVMWSGSDVYADGERFDLVINRVIKTPEGSEVPNSSAETYLTIEAKGDDGDSGYSIVGVNSGHNRICLNNENNWGDDGLLCFDESGSKISILAYDWPLGGGTNQVVVPFVSGINDFKQSMANALNGQTFTSNYLFGQHLYEYSVRVNGVSPDNNTSGGAAAGATPGTSQPTSSEDTCMSAGGMATLGWILCPVLDLAVGASENLYDTFLEPALQVDPQLFSGSGDNTRIGWENFRTIANILFIILLLVVIFSQLTGVGIDNYGIKKILPKLIVVAVLVNLSYWICVAFVDLSNILGNAFQAMFDGLASGGGLNVNLDGLSKSDGSQGGVFPVSGALISVGILGALFTGIWAVITNPAIILTLLVSALGVVISVFFLFILLSVRQAAIVVLVVLSPLAIVCYMLPNTKSMFDKWLKFFQGLLLVYPIAGLLVGGGNYVSKLLLGVGGASNGVFSAITAMIAGIVPIFFIPTVLKNAFSAMGNIGTMITGLGQRAGRFATDKASKSGVYRNLQQSGLERRTRMSAGLDKDGKPVRGIRRGIATVMGGGRRNMARARGQYAANVEARDREENMMGQGFDAVMAGVEAKAARQRVADQEALLVNGKVDLNGATVNVNNPESMQNYHAEMLNRHRNATSAEERAAAMDRIKAAQNIMAKTADGRGRLQENYENAINSGSADGGLREGASHLMGEYGDVLKSNNRGAHKLARDLASGRSFEATDGDAGIAEDVRNNEYKKYGTEQYTAETMAGADSAALNNLVSQMANMNSEQIRALQATAYEALEKQRNGTLNIKPEVATTLNTVVSGGNGAAPAYTPPESKRSTDEQMLRTLDEINSQLRQHGPTPTPTPPSNSGNNS